MKQPNPLVPQGSFEAQARGKSQVRFAVFTILTIHVVVLGALLIHGAGCKREENKDAAASAPTNAAPTDYTTTPPFGSNDVVTPVTPGALTGGTGTTAVVPPPTNPVVPAPTPVTPIPTPAPTPASSMAESGAPAEYAIAKGDTFSGLAQKNGTTVKALKAANPGVDPTKLKVGQKIKIPARAATATGGAAATPAAESPDVYVVKAGDNLGKIAKEFGTTAKAIQKANNLTTTQIRVGQKLKLPPRTLPASKATPTPAAPGGTAPLTVPPPLPAPAQ